MAAKFTSINPAQLLMQQTVHPQRQVSRLQLTDALDLGGRGRIKAVSAPDRLKMPPSHRLVEVVFPRRAVLTRGREDATGKALTLYSPTALVTMQRERERPNTLRSWWNSIKR